MENTPFDLSAFELSDTATLTVQNAAGNGDLLGTDGQPVTIELYGPGSKEAVRAQHKAGQAATQRMQAMMRGKIDPKAAEKADQELADKLTLLTKRISANFPVEPAALYANTRLGYITRQVVRFLDDDANFSKASTGS